MHQAVCEVGTKTNKMHVSGSQQVAHTNLGQFKRDWWNRRGTTSIIQYPEPRNVWTAATWRPEGRGLWREAMTFCWECMHLQSKREGEGPLLSLSSLLQSCEGTPPVARARSKGQGGLLMQSREVSLLDREQGRERAECISGANRRHWVNPTLSFEVRTGQRGERQGPQTMPVQRGQCCVSENPGRQSDSEEITTQAGSWEASQETLSSKLNTNDCRTRS